MGTALEGGFDNLTAGLNSVNNNLSNANSQITQLYSESKNKLELAVSNFLSLSNKTIEKNTSAYFDLKPTIPSGYTLVGAFIRDTQALENGIIPIYSLATQGSISFELLIWLIKRLQ